jgi:hypothetical protein
MGTNETNDGDKMEYLKLRGQMLMVQEWDAIVFLAIPV